MVQTNQAQHPPHLSPEPENSEGPPASDVRSAHVIVVGNEKGGTGKSTFSIHITMALLKAGYRVATIDLDTRQQSLTRFLQNRASFAADAAWDMAMPQHFAAQRSETADANANEVAEFASFAAAISAVEHTQEFVVIDTPASDSYLMRLAHSLADTLVCPVNDSFVDIDVLAHVHPDARTRGAIAHYAEIVLDARRRRQQMEQGVMDWVLVRNRMASIHSNNAKQIATTLERMAQELDFRVVEGLHDRVIFRELFPIGLTALNPIEQGAKNGLLTPSQLAARHEILTLVDGLALPLRGADHTTHQSARRDWYARVKASIQASP